MSSENNDLSPYELARLERIKRNEQRLLDLGLIVKPKPPKVVTPREKKVNKAPRKRRERSAAVPTRSSKRLKQLNEGKKFEEDANVDAIFSGEEDDDVESAPIEKVNYESMPNEPDNLDDDEFQVYVSLRAWRLQRKNELEIEPYKICQNKTLCHLIRNRRNNVGFASGNVDEDVEKDLLSVWGIGPSKAARDGFGWEMLDILQSDENVKHLDLSRKNTSGKDT